MRDIKAFQGYVSEVMRYFFLLENFKLQPYKNTKEPLVVFGCYRPRDYETVIQHQGEVIVVWMGNDTYHQKTTLAGLNKKNIIHATWLDPIQVFLKKGGLNCLLLKTPIKEIPYPKPFSKLGDKVYAYVAKGKPRYHGSKVVDSLRIKYPLLIGDKSIPRNKWYQGASQAFYSQAFVGLVLSIYAGGGMSTQEMGVRGIRVITNVSSLPNCIPWKTKEDVERIINDEAKKIGQSNNGLIKEMYDQMVEVKGCFDLQEMMR